MATSEFFLILFSGVVIGLLLSMSLRWIGGKLLTANQRKEGGDTIRDKELIEGIHLNQKKEV